MLYIPYYLGRCSLKWSTFFTNITKELSSTKLGELAEKALHKSDAEIIAFLKAHSPYDPDKKAGSHYADNWKVRRLRFGTTKQLAGMTIINETPEYGQFMEEGAEPGSDKAPWYFPQRHKTGKKRGQFKKRSGKLKAVDGRVWAGGLNPGHSLTVGGALSFLAKEKGLVSNITIDVSSAIVKGIFK